MTSVDSTDFCLRVVLFIKFISYPDIGSEIVTVTCKITEGSGGKCGKRYLRSEERKKIGQDLSDRNECSNVYRITRANELMKEGDPEPPQLYGKSVLRVAKHEAATSKHLDKNPIRTLELMQLSPAYKEIIHFLSVKPFMVLFWLNYQIHVYNNYWKKSDSCLCVDASGNFVRKIIRANGEKSNVIYLYECVILTSSGQYAVAYMFSESHNANTIGFFLKEMIRSGAFPPKEVVCDMSKALLNAVACTFTRFQSIEDYADSLRYEIPPCYIRLDVAHFKNLYNVFFKDVRPIVSKLYKKVLNLFIESRSVDEAREHLRRFLIICLSETEGLNSSGEKTQCEITKNELKAILTIEDSDSIKAFVKKDIPPDEESKFK